MNTSYPFNQLPVPDDPDENEDSAVNLIRGKLDALYSQEPDVVTETIESYQEPPDQRSKHQKFMAELASSGKPFAQIQLEWHEYYKSLPDQEKHEVWEEFYSAQSVHPVFTPQPAVTQPQPMSYTPPSANVAQVGSFDYAPDQSAKQPKEIQQTVSDIKEQIISKVAGRGKLSRKQHLKSLGFGLSVGALSLAVMMFGFFNERIIAPFITPSRTASSTPLIMEPSGAAVGKDPKIIIPKINVEVPVVYDVETVEEDAVQAGLERGVVHYATTSKPGEQGNGAIFGHSSNNILNRGKYKFAFVLLSRLESGDTFYIEKDGVRYAYRIFDKKIVPPEDISVLDSVPGKVSTMALITCDPPGTTINRLVVWGEQISPDPNQNLASTALETDEQPEQLAGNPESLWSRMWGSIF